MFLYSNKMFGTTHPPTEEFMRLLVLNIDHPVGKFLLRQCLHFLLRSALSCSWHSWHSFL